MLRITAASILKKGKRLRAVKLPNSKRLKRAVQETRKEQEKILAQKNKPIKYLDRPMDI